MDPDPMPSPASNGSASAMMSSRWSGVNAIGPMVVSPESATSTSVASNAGSSSSMVRSYVVGPAVNVGFFEKSASL
jgi:hypothetical protein